MCLVLLTAVPATSCVFARSGDTSAQARAMLCAKQRARGRGVAVERGGEKAPKVMLRLRGGSEEVNGLEEEEEPTKPKFPGDRTWKPNAERWAEAGVSLQPDFGPDANLDVPVEHKLGDAAEHGDVEAIQKLLQAGANVKHTDWAGYTALHRAAFNGHADCCEVLIKAGALINAQDAVGGRTPLHQAATRNHKAVAKKLIELGADPHIKDFPYTPNLDNMNIPGLREALAELPAVAQGAGEDKIHAYPGMTPLEYAEFEGHKDTADFLRPWTKEY